jgi:hypothetical protein
MKKIRLDIDTLDVESFATGGLEHGTRGTVRGAGTAVSACYCYPISYFSEPTCIKICPPVRYTESPDCLQIDTAALTCATCLGMPGC